MSRKAADRVVDELEAIYSRSVDALRRSLADYLDNGVIPDPVARANGLFAYPALLLQYDGNPRRSHDMRAFGRLTIAGDYAVSITSPALFRDYLAHQIELLTEDFGAEVCVGVSDQEIPYPYVLDGGDLDLSSAVSADLARIFPSADLATIGDELVDGLWSSATSKARPLALFDAPRVDFSLARLRHYTGSKTEHFQRYVLFTNYHRYVDEFVRWGSDQLGAGSRYTMLTGAGGLSITEPGTDAVAAVADSAWRRHQMPAYHLVTDDGSGITLVNIGVGPSNAKTITDHLAVLRPEAWLMIGHCGGLRGTQRIGDYVLAHAYLRDDHVLDDILPPEIPIPPIAEVQQALIKGAQTISGETIETLRKRLRTGTVVTTDDRNWELRYSASALRFNQSRAVAIDMESATLAAQAYRFRVPFGTLLCVSDKPLHGELKLPGQANRFYERTIGEHLQVGIAAIHELRLVGDRLHSRKLRAFDEPPFR